MPVSSSPGLRRAVRLIALGGTVAAAVIVAALSPAGASTTRAITRASLPSAKQLIKETQKTMSGQSSVRITISSSDKSTKQSESVTEDAGESNGLETILFGKATVSVRLTSKAAYISGNTLGLEKIVDLSSKSAKTVGDKWIVVTKGSTPFKNIVAGGTIGPLTKSLLPTTVKTVNVKSDTLNGKDVYALTWTVTSSGSKIDLKLDIASRGATLPIELTATEGSFLSVTQFGRWGEQISVSVPTKTIAYSKVGA